MKATVDINWKINTSALTPKHYEEKKLGKFSTDFWSLKLCKIPLEENNFNIIFSLERKQDVHATKYSKIKVLVMIKLVFSDSKISSKCNYVEKFEHGTSEVNYKLKKKLKKLFKSGNIISITGEVFFHLKPDIPDLIYIPDKPDIKTVPAIQTLNTLSSDIKKLCCTKTFADVILRCDSQVFYAHKNILASRCSVFAEIIENCAANEEVKIDIKDIESDVLKVVLEFIYSGETGQMTFQLACELLTAADTYRLNELKTFCIDYIKNSFSVENVLNYFLKYEAVKTYALQFIAENILEIKKTPEWENAKQDFPDLVSKLKDLSEIEDINYI